MGLRWPNDWYVSRLLTHLSRDLEVPRHIKSDWRLFWKSKKRVTECFNLGLNNVLVVKWWSYEWECRGRGSLYFSPRPDWYLTLSPLVVFIWNSVMSAIMQENTSTFLFCSTEQILHRNFHINLDKCYDFQRLCFHCILSPRSDSAI